MSEIKEIFYNLFWQNKACQNLFLLSKEELLDTKILEFEDNSSSLSMPRIIISNIENKEGFIHETIRIRNENHNIRSENLLNSKIELYTPILTNFLEGKFGNSLEKLINDFENDPWELLGKGITLLTGDEEEFEKTIIDFLQEYGFVGHHLNSFKELEQYFEKETISKNIKSVLSENNLWNFLEFLKSVKDIYVNESYRSLYNSNQILVNALYDTDNYKSRIQLFSLLFESGILLASNEDAFIECVHCEPGTYKGVFQLKLNPQKLQELKCPVCSKELTYYVPYELHRDIYDIVKLQDGFLQHALINLLPKYAIEYKTNQHFLNDIEIDCLFKNNKTVHIVECKMYKVSTPKEKLKSKIRKHFGKLTSDVKRIDEFENKKRDIIQPILLVNLIDDALLKEIELELWANNSDDISQKTMVLNISLFESFLSQ